jgi:uncharacterized protein YqeY
MLIEKIKAEYLQARKSKDEVKVKLLSTFIGDAEMIGKNDGNRQTKDEEVVALAKKYVNNAKETMKHIEDPTICAQEISILNQYIPSQYTEEELKVIISACILTFGLNMGAVMKDLKTNHAGRYDGALASKIYKSLTT